MEVQGTKPLGNNAFSGKKVFSCQSCGYEGVIVLLNGKEKLYRPK